MNAPGADTDADADAAGTSGIAGVDPPRDAALAALCARIVHAYREPGEGLGVADAPHTAAHAAPNAAPRRAPHIADATDPAAAHAAAADAGDAADTSAPADVAAWRKCAALGLTGLSLPIAYGGNGFTASATACALEAFGSACPDAGLVFRAAAHLLAAAMPIAAFGTDAQKAALLPDLAAGRRVAAAAMTEAASGSDVSAIATRAWKEGAHWRLHGEKAFVTNGPVADLILVYAVTDPALGFWRSSAFIVDAAQPGVTRGPALDTIGLRSAPIGTIRFEDCRVPADARLGAEGQGAIIFEHAMRWERSCLFAAWVGLMQRQLEEAIAAARSTIRFGRAIGKHQAVAFRLADMKLRLESCRLLVARACARLDAGCATRMDAALAKLAVSEAAVQSSLDSMQIHGGRGLLTTHGVEAYLRDMAPGTIYSGTSDMQRAMIAAELGL